MAPEGNDDIDRAPGGEAQPMPGWRRWGRAAALGLAGLVAGGVLAATLTAGAAEPTGTTGSGATTQTVQSGESGSGSGGSGSDRPCPDGERADGSGGGEAPSQGTPQY